MGAQRDGQIEVSLIRIRLPLLAHIVGRRLAEVESPDRSLGHLFGSQLDPKMVQNEFQ